MFRLKILVQAVVLLLFFLNCAVAQNKSSGSIYVNAYEVDFSNSKNFDQFSFLNQYLNNVKFLGLGEASHGTEEFYKIKSMIAKYVITNLDYSIIAFEIEETFVESINNYVKTGSGDIKEELKSYGLYNSDELYNLFEWIRKFNFNKSNEDKVQIIGFDNKEYWSDPLSRDSLMAKNFVDKIENKKYIIWSHNTHLMKSNTWDITNSNIKAMGNFLHQYLGKDYYFIAFDTNEGNYNVIEDGSLKEYSFKMNKELFDMKMKAFFIDLNSDSNPFRDKNYMITTLFSNWQGEPKPAPSKAGVDFDGLIFVHESSSSKAID